MKLDGRSALAVLALLALLALAVWMLGDAAEPELQTGQPAATPVPSTPRTGSDSASPGAAPDHPQTQPATARRIDASERARVLTAIVKALGQRDPQVDGGAAAVSGSTHHDGIPGPAELDALRPARVDKAYLQSRIRELIPLIKECYELARDETPELEGTVVVNFTIVGDEGEGALVTHSEVRPHDGQLPPSPTLAECVRETMYALQMEAPEGGGQINVTYPFRFSLAAPETPSEP